WSSSVKVPFPRSILTSGRWHSTDLGLLTLGHLSPFHQPHGRTSRPWHRGETSSARSAMPGGSGTLLLIGRVRGRGALLLIGQEKQQCPPYRRRELNFEILAFLHPNHL